MYKETQITGKTIVVWFSCGAASAVAAKKTIERYGENNTIRVVNNPVKEEHEDNRRFLSDVQDWLGQEIEIAINPQYPEHSIKEIFDKRKYMSGIKGAPCTMLLKKKAREYWELHNDFDFIVLGFTLDEVARHERFCAIEPYPVLPVLIDEQITKDDCFSYLLSANISLPVIYSLGFPNANCIGCVKATSATYWNTVRKEFPEVFKDRAEQSREIGCKLAYQKGKRVFLDELSPDTKGRKLKLFQAECGIFCDSKN